MSLSRWLAQLKLKSAARRNRRRSRVPFRPSFLCLEDRVVPNISFKFDYSLDSTGFFNDPARRALLESAGRMLTDRIADTLAAVVASGTDTWTPSITNPATGNLENGTKNLVVPADTIIAYAGARNLSGGAIGRGGPNGFSSGGAQAWLDLVQGRGEAGALAAGTAQTDFAPLTVSIAFDPRTNWFFSSTTSGLGSTQSDFLSVALHELSHSIGFGTANSWKHWISGSSFTGPTSARVQGSNIPLSPDLAHWAEGTSYGGQETEMDPSLTNGTRKLETDLDFAGLGDLGWQIIPGAPTLKSPTTTTADTTPTLTWDATNFADHYLVTLFDNTANKAVFTNQNVAGTSFTVTTSLTDGHRYTWDVQAVNKGGNGGAKGTASFTIGQAVQPPAAPEPLALDVAGTTQIKLTWKLVSGATGYEVDQLIGGVFKSIKTLGNAVSTYTVTGLSPNTTYTFKVAAVNDGGSTFTQPKSAKTDQPEANTPITIKWGQLGGSGGILGSPTGPEVDAPNGGRFRPFQNGGIYWTSTTGAHELHGLIYAKYQALGGPGGVQGYPLSDVHSGYAGAVYASFQHGQIILPPNSGTAYEIHGLIYTAYNNLPNQSPILGQPLSDVHSGYLGATYIAFQRGQIILPPGSSKAFVIYGKLYDAYNALGNPSPILGQPTTSVEAAAGGGAKIHFERGVIIIAPKATQAFVLTGLIWKKWERQFAEAGVLGYPTSNILGASGGGQKAIFEDGVVYLAPGASDAFIITNASIRGKWDSLGAEGGALGYPTTDIAATRNTGRVVKFQGGVIWHPLNQASFYISNGLILTRYLGMGAQDSGLGYPISDITTGAGGGKIVRFEGGVLTQAPGTSETHIIANGPILTTWLNAGGINSTFGYPTTDIFAFRGGQRVNFTNGAIVNLPGYGIIVFNAQHPELPYNTPWGQALIEQWITLTQNRLNSFTGTASFNANKPWHFNKYGILEGTYVHSVAAPDDFRYHGYNKYWEMWDLYPNGPGQPWSDANWNSAGIPPLRQFVNDRLTPIDVPAPFKTVWQQLGAFNGPLGAATGNPANANTSPFGTTSRWQPFENGLGVDPTSGAHANDVFAVIGPIARYYQSLGGTGSFLGVPIGNQGTFSTKFGTKGLVQSFEGGFIFWYSNGSHVNSTFEVHGAIASLYRSVGVFGSSLGAPVSNEYSYNITGMYNGGRRSDFEGGFITWSSSTGAASHPYVDDKITALWQGMGGAGGVIGYPTTAQGQATPSPAGTKGRYQNFSNGEIDVATTGARAGKAYVSYGPIGNKYVSIGGTHSFLGFPLDSTGQWSGGSTDSTGHTYAEEYQHYEGGTIHHYTLGPRTGQVYVLGAGFEYAYLHSNVNLGPPISNQYSYSVPGIYNGGVRLDFDRGFIVWTAQTGYVAHPKADDVIYQVYVLYRSRLGAPVTNPGPTVTSYFGTQGRYEVFQGGEIYVATTGAHAGEAYPVFAPILTEFHLHAGINSIFAGFPINVGGGFNGTTRSGEHISGVYQDFEGTEIVGYTVGSRAGHAFIVQGAILSVWRSNGGINSVGAPIDNSYQAGGGVIRQDFLFGYITFTQQGGAVLHRT